jgi:predicted RNA-binding protein YlqC (UPF0109 family)
VAVSIDQQFVEYIVKSLVGHPDEVKVERRIDEKGVLLELSVNPEDLGRVIGKRGSTAQSLRTLLRALGTKNDARYNLKIIDTGPPPERREDREDRDDAPTTEEPAVKPTDDDSTAADDQTVSDEIEEQRQDEDTASITDDEDELPETASRDSHDDVISRTRKELADLDDLDV